MVHSSVHSVYLFLQDNGFLVDVVHQHCKLTEKVGLGYCSHNVDSRDEEQLLIVSGTEIIPEEKEAACVERYHIFVRPRLIEESPLRLPSPQVVEGWNPFLLDIDQVVPHASNEMNVHEQEKYQLDKLDRRFDILLKIQVHNDSI